jgi:hypothetical protein
MARMNPERRERIRALALATFGEEVFERLGESVSDARDDGRLQIWQGKILARLTEAGEPISGLKEFLAAFDEDAAQPKPRPLDLPPFPRLKWEDIYWAGKASLPAWADFWDGADGVFSEGDCQSVRQQQERGQANAAQPSPGCRLPEPARRRRGDP